MPENIECPECSRKLRVPDHLLGKRVKCPSCSTIFTAQAPEHPPEPAEPRAATRRPKRPVDEEEDEERPASRRKRQQPPEEKDFEEETTEDEKDQEPEEEEKPEEEERPRRRRRIRTDWPKIRNGVALVLVSVSIILLAIPAGGVAGVIEAGRAPPQMPPAVGPGQFQPPNQTLPLAVWVGAAMGVLSDLVALVGYFFCMAAPTRYNAKTLATACLILGAAVLVGTLVVVAVTATRGGSASLELVRAFLALSKFFLFLFFLRAIAMILREEGLQRSVKYLIIVNAVFLVGLVALVIVAVVFVGALAGIVAQQQPGNPQAPPNVAAGAAGGAFLLFGCGCFDLILGLTSFIWYIIALVQTRNAITRHIE